MSKAAKKVDTKILKSHFAKVTAATAQLDTITAQAAEASAAVEVERQQALGDIYAMIGTEKVGRKGLTPCQVVKVKGKYDENEELIEGSERYQLRVERKRKQTLSI